MKLSSSQKTRRRGRIEIIPLIDIMFFLLATFVMVSTAMIKNRGIAVRLPVAASGGKEARNDAATVTVTAAGEYYFDKNKVTPAELSGALRELRAKTEDAKVFINGDSGATVGSLVAALDEVKKAGIGKVAIQTKPASE